jgi:hypothetical protein
MLLTKILCPTSLYTLHSTGVTRLYLGNFGFKSRCVENFHGLSRTLQLYSGLVPQI